MMEGLVLCSVLLLLGGATGVGDDTLRVCLQDSASPVCNCSFTKRYSDELSISCADSTNNCTWFHKLNGSLVSIEEKFLTSDKRTITLLGYYDNESYGYFVAINSSDVSCYYVVRPPLDAVCNNCTGIKINGTRRNNEDIFCTHLGDNMIVQADVPLISTVFSFVLRVNSVNNPTDCVQHGDISDLTYICTNLTSNNIGEYMLHISFQIDHHSNPEWGSNYVTVIVQSLTISFTQSMYTVNESAVLQPVLNLNNPSLIDIVVQIFTTDVTAFGGNLDYGSGPYSVIVPAGNTTDVMFEVKFNNDNISEYNETFDMTINASSLPGCANRGNPYQATVTIVDDDAAAYTVNFNQSTYNVYENSGSVEIQMTLSGVTSTPITIEVLSMDGSANGGDYGTGPFAVTFPAGMTSAILNVSITDDDIFESNETFDLIINIFALPPNITIGDTSQATVTILNDDASSSKSLPKENEGLMILIIVSSAVIIPLIFIFIIMYIIYKKKTRVSITTIGGREIENESSNNASTPIGDSTPNNYRTFSPNNETSCSHSDEQPTPMEDFASGSTDVIEQATPVDEFAADGIDVIASSYSSLHVQSSENVTKQMSEEITGDLQTKCPLSHVVSGSCDHSGGVITSEHGDLKLTIPEGAIKDGDVVTFSIASDLYGPFVLPSKSRANLASPYYWIGASRSYHFHKPVQVEFEHYAVVTACDPSHYQLLSSEDDDESYTMQPVDYELVFTAQGNMSLCTFETYEFCSYCLYLGCKDPMINRIAVICLKSKGFQYLSHFTVEMWFSLPISHCIWRIKKLYTRQNMMLDMKCSYYFEASCDKNSTDYFTLSYDENIDSWCLSNCRSTEIKTKCINFYNYYTDTEELRANELISLFPPRFIVDVTKKSNCNTHLSTKIMVALHKVEGKSLESIPFCLYVPNSTETGVMQRKSSTSVDKHDCDEHDCDEYDCDEHNCNENTPKLQELVKYSRKVANHWEVIALNLKGCEDKIAVIDIDYNKVELKCYKMFSTWLQSDSSPCWCHFIQALHATGLHNTAEEITIKYLKCYSERITVI